MAEYTPSRGAVRWQPESPSRRHGTVAERRLAERAQEYDRALKQSQNAALRRRGVGMHLSTNAAATAGGTRVEGLPEAVHSPVSHTTAKPEDMKMNVLVGTAGDSNNPPILVTDDSNINPFPLEETVQQSSDRQESGISTSVASDIHRSDEISRAGEVRSELGESYVDGKVQRGRPSVLPSSGPREEGVDAIEDGGMLGLLAQIYGTRAPRL